MGNLFMDRWNLLDRQSFFRSWKDEKTYVILDGTNNHCERTTGWWFIEHYRSMGGYRQGRSALGISRLITLAGNHLACGLRLADLMA